MTESKPAEPSFSLPNQPPGWASLVSERPVDSDQRIVDAHHHLWSKGEGLPIFSPYLTEDLLADVGGHNVVGTVFVECNAGYRTEGPEHLRSVGETEFVVREARKSASTKAPILAIVGQADLTLGDLVQETLDAHTEAGGGLFRGIRQLFGAGHGPARDLLLEPAFREGVARLGRGGYSFDAMTRSTELKAWAKFADSVPDTILILNHLGAPAYRPGVDNRDEVMAVWRDGVRAIAACPNFYMKVGGIGMDAIFGMGWSKQPLPPTSDMAVAWWADDIRFCIDTMGPDRCLFESNFPVDRMGMGYTVLWNTLQKIASPYSASEQAELFAGTAERAYRLEIPRG